MAVVKKELVEILETDVEGRDEIVLLLEQTYDLKQEIEGLTDEFNKRKDQLAVLQMEHELDGIRHNKLVFVNRWQEGRESLDTQKFFQELVSHGVRAEVVQDAMKASMKKSEPYYVKELKLLK